jgi:hypothetical protein
MSDIKSTTPLADALAGVDEAQGNDIESERRLGWARAAGMLDTVRELEALRNLAEAVRASLIAFDETDVRALAVTAAELDDHDAECGAGEYLSERQSEVLNKARELFGDGS